MDLSQSIGRSVEFFLPHLLPLCSSGEECHESLRDSEPASYDSCVVDELVCAELEQK